MVSEPEWQHSGLFWAQHEVRKYEDERLTYEMIFGGCMAMMDGEKKIGEDSC